MFRDPAAERAYAIVGDPAAGRADAIVCDPSAARRRRQSGTSLIELVIAIVVVAISLTGTLLVVDTTTRRSAEPMLERQAISLAAAYLDEALSKAYLDPQSGSVCPAPETRRDLLDNVCDFDGLDERGARDPNGNAIAGLEGYRIQLAVDRAAQLGGLSGSSEVLRVDVTVTDGLGRPVRLSGYRTNP
ncbi:MAG: type II secretion system protein [Myxococcota bacterium]